MNNICTDTLMRPWRAGACGPVYFTERLSRPSRLPRYHRSHHLTFVLSTIVRHIYKPASHLLPSMESKSTDTKLHTEDSLALLEKVRRDVTGEHRASGGDREDRPIRLLPLR